MSFCALTAGAGVGVGVSVGMGVGVGVGAGLMAPLPHLLRLLLRPLLLRLQLPVLANVANDPASCGAPKAWSRALTRRSTPTAVLQQTRTRLTSAQVGRGGCIAQHMRAKRKRDKEAAETAQPSNSEAGPSSPEPQPAHGAPAGSPQPDSSAAQSPWRSYVPWWGQ